MRGLGPTLWPNVVIKKEVMNCKSNQQLSTVWAHSSVTATVTRFHFFRLPNESLARNASKVAKSANSSGRG